MWSSISSVVWTVIAEDGKNQWMNNFEFTALTQSYVNNQPTLFLYTGPPSFFFFHKIFSIIIDVSFDLISFANVHRPSSLYFSISLSSWLQNFSYIYYYKIYTYAGTTLIFWVSLSCIQSKTDRRKTDVKICCHDSR